MKKSLLIKNCQAYNSSPQKTSKKLNLCRVFNVNYAFRLLLLMVSISSLAYIFQINQLATMGQEINKKETLLEQLKEDNKALEIKITQLKSSYHFESERDRLRMINPDQVSFVEINKDETVAMR